MNTWDRIEGNEFGDVVTAAMTDIFPDDPPRFLARTPYGFNLAAWKPPATSLGPLAAAYLRRNSSRFMLWTEVRHRGPANYLNFPVCAYNVAIPHSGR